jgi:hypothetical protein
MSAKSPADDRRSSALRLVPDGWRYARIGEPVDLSPPSI